MKDIFAALILDIVDSRKELDRQKVQEIMKEGIKFFNEYYKDYIVKPLVCGAGDEFQGLFNSTKFAYSYVRKLQMYVYPIKIRAGIGIGKVKYLVDEWISTEIDGDAYYYARDALNEIPNKGTNVIFINDNTNKYKLINTISLTNAKIKTSETAIMRYIEELIDFLSPLDNYKKIMTIEDFEFIKKSCLRYLKSINETNKLSFIENKQIALDETIKSISIDALSQAYNNVRKVTDLHNLYYSDEIPWGIVKLIEPFVGTSQQNINQYLNLRGIKESRGIDAGIINSLEIMDKKEEK